MADPERRKQLVRKLLKGIETGDPDAAAVVNEAKYVQHNPQTQEGSEGLAALFARLAKTNPRVNVVRAFADGDFVFAHTEYDFATRRIGFEVFRFEGDQAVEHWDNIQARRGRNPSGRSMVDGPAEPTDHAHTEANRGVVRSFAEEVLIGGQRKTMSRYFDGDALVQHSPEIEDGVAALREALGAEANGEPHGEPHGQPHGQPVLAYQRLHRVLAEGSFVLTVCEGTRGGVHSAFYDLYRLSGGAIAEHWDTVEAVAPRSEWKNENGKF
ncbi:MAG: nuclear transport factor 2 family protein [Myxococcota bacterium]